MDRLRLAASGSDVRCVVGPHCEVYLQKAATQLPHEVLHPSFLQAVAPAITLFPASHLPANLPSSFSSPHSVALSASSFMTQGHIFTHVAQSHPLVDPASSKQRSLNKLDACCCGRRTPASRS